MRFCDFYGIQIPALNYDQFIILIKETFITSRIIIRNLKDKTELIMNGISIQSNILINHEDGLLHFTHVKVGFFVIS